MGKYFGTDGFRGKAGEGLTAYHAYEIGRFLGWYYGREGRARVVVGKDTRRHAYGGAASYHNNICEGESIHG